MFKITAQPQQELGDKLGIFNVYDVTLHGFLDLDRLLVIKESYNISEYKSFEIWSKVKKQRKIYSAHLLELLKHVNPSQDISEVTTQNYLSFFEKEDPNIYNQAKTLLNGYLNLTSIFLSYHCGNPIEKMKDLVRSIPVTQIKQKTKAIQQYKELKTLVGKKQSALDKSLELAQKDVIAYTFTFEESIKHYEDLNSKYDLIIDRLDSLLPTITSVTNYKGFEEERQEAISKFFKLLSLLKESDCTRISSTETIVIHSTTGFNLLPPYAVNFSSVAYHLNLTYKAYLSYLLPKEQLDDSSQLSEFIPINSELNIYNKTYKELNTLVKNILD